MKGLGHAWLCALAAVCSCAGPSNEATFEPLPFHVAVIPLQEEDMSLRVRSDDDEDEVVFDITLPAGGLSTAVQQALDGATFVAATLLVLAAPDRRPHACW